MTGFFPLLRLQLLSRYADMKPRNLKKQFQEKKSRVIGMVIGILVAVVYLGGFLIFMESAMLNFLMKAGMPDLLLSMAVTLSMLGTLIMSFFFIMSSLYFGRDAAHIASLPVKPRVVLSAKLTQVWISESGISAVIILPAAILYGIRVGADALLYVRALIAALAAPILPIVIVSFVSTLLIRLSSLWKHRDIIVTVSGILFIGAYMFLAFNMGSMSGSSDSMESVIAGFMQSNMARVEAVTHMFPPAGWAAKGILGDWGSLFLFVAVCAAAIGFTVWALGFWYRSLSLLLSETPTETKKKGRLTAASFSGNSTLKALCLRETRQILRVPSYATNSLPTAVMPVFMVVMMYLAFNSAAGQEGGLQALLGTVNQDLVLPILTAIMAYMAGMNPALSTAVSREGKGHDVMNSLPVTAKTIVLSKLIVGYAMSMIGVLLAAVVIGFLFPAYAHFAAMAFVLCALYCFLTSCLALRRDIKHPKLDWVTEQEAIKQNFGAAVGMFIGWAILIALGGITYLLYSLEINVYLYFAVIAAVLLALSVIFYHMLMKAAEKHYCAG